MSLQSIRLSEKQFKALEYLNDNITEELAYGGGANGGKSWLGCTWLLTNCLAYPGSKWFIGRNELKRLRTTTYITWTKVCKTYGIGKSYWQYNGQDHYIQFKNGSRIDLLDLKFIPSDPLYERYGSAEFTSGWIEEGGEVHFDAYDTLKSRINRHLNDQFKLTGKLLITCNPKKNWLYSGFFIPWRQNILPDNKKFIQALITDNPFREKNSEAKLQQIENTAKKQRLLFGNWDYDDEPDKLILFEWLEAAKARPEIPGNSYLGVDVARYGDDLTAFAKMTGNKLVEIKTKNHMSIDKTAVLVAMKIVADPINPDHVGIDVVGLGAGVVDILTGKGFQVQGIGGGEKPVIMPDTKEYEFNNLRSQMWWTVREDLRQGKLRIEFWDNRLVEDLTAPKYEIRNDRTIVVESKDSLKKRLGRSPDTGDAFVYANWMRHLDTGVNKVEYRPVQQRRWE